MGSCGCRDEGCIQSRRNNTHRACRAHGHCQPCSAHLYARNQVKVLESRVEAWRTHRSPSNGSCTDVFHGVTQLHLCRRRRACDHTGARDDGCHGCFVHSRADHRAPDRRPHDRARWNDDDRDDTGLGAEGDIVSGFLLASIGVLLGSFSGVLQRKYAPLHDTVPLAFPMFVTGTIVSIAIGTFVGFDDFGTYGSNLWILLTVLALGSTLLPFGATLYASKHASATLVAVTAYLAPLVAIVGGAVLLDEQITPAILAGAAVTILGVSLVGRGRRTTT